MKRIHQTKHKGAISVGEVAFQHRTRIHVQRDGDSRVAGAADVGGIVNLGVGRGDNAAILTVPILLALQSTANVFDGVQLASCLRLLGGEIIKDGDDGLAERTVPRTVLDFAPFSKLYACVLAAVNVVEISGCGLQ